MWPFWQVVYLSGQWMLGNVRVPLGSLNHDQCDCVKLKCRENSQEDDSNFPFLNNPKKKEKRSVSVSSGLYGLSRTLICTKYNIVQGLVNVDFFCVLVEDVWGNCPSLFLERWWAEHLIFRTCIADRRRMTDRVVRCTCNTVSDSCRR